MVAAGGSWKNVIKPLTGGLVGASGSSPASAGFSASFSVGGGVSRSPSEEFAGTSSVSPLGVSVSSPPVGVSRSLIGVSSSPVSRSPVGVSRSPAGVSSSPWTSSLLSLLALLLTSEPLASSPTDTYWWKNKMKI